MEFGTTLKDGVEEISELYSHSHTRWLFVGWFAYRKSHRCLVTRFQWTVKKMGIQLIHLGIIMLLVGQLFTQAMQEESRMQINKGESSNYIERFHGVELAFSDVTDPNTQKVVTIPQQILEKGGTIQLPTFLSKYKSNILE